LDKAAEGSIAGPGCAEAEAGRLDPLDHDVILVRHEVGVGVRPDAVGIPLV
jgi:hypothetical protein